LPSDNVVYPKPSRAEAIYDNGISYLTLTDNSIRSGDNVVTRGYAATGGGVNAFWISVGP
jgi:hypothetical protein